MVKVLHRNTGGFGWDKDEGEVLILCIRGARPNEGVDIVRPFRTGAPPLCAIDDNLVAIKFCAGLNTWKITADIGLRQAITEEHLATCYLWEQVFFLLQRAVLRDVGPAVKGSVDVRPGHSRPTLAELINDGSRGYEILACSAILLRDGEADQPHVCDFLEERPVPGVVLIPLNALFTRHVVGHEPLQLTANFDNMIGFIRKGLVAHCVSPRLVWRPALLILEDSRAVLQKRQCAMVSGA